jgi:hypothetical protein
VFPLITASIASRKPRLYAMTPPNNVFVVINGKPNQPTTTVVADLLRTAGTGSCEARICAIRSARLGGAVEDELGGSNNMGKRRQRSDGHSGSSRLTSSLFPSAFVGVPNNAIGDVER